MFSSVDGQISPREQGDIGERSALCWLIDQGATVYLPFGHSPDVDLVAGFGNQFVRVQVKTSNCIQKWRYAITLATRGGNQSWSGLVKRFSSDRCDYLFVLVGDGRRWFIPSDVVEGGSGLMLGGPKYETYEVEPDRPLTALMERRIARLPAPGGVPERSNGTDCKSVGSAFAGSNPAPATGSATAPISTVEAAPSSPLGADAPT